MTLRLTLATVFAITVFATNAAKAAVYSENFDSGNAGYAMTGLWHVTQNFPFSNPNALGYVHNETAGSTPNGDYATGGNANSGTATSPLILLAADSTTLTFEAFNHNEYGDDPNFYDRLQVYINNGT